MSRKETLNLTAAVANLVILSREKMKLTKNITKAKNTNVDLALVVPFTLLGEVYILLQENRVRKQLCHCATLKRKDDSSFKGQVYFLYR